MRYDMRWYHYYIYLVFMTNLLAMLYAAMTEWTTIPFIIVFGIMTAFSSICFLAECAVMGLTAKTGGFFWTAVTFGVAVHRLPI